MYDPQIGRWHVVDKMAEAYSSITPYAYCANNPIRLIDVDGRYFNDENEENAQRKERKIIRQQHRLANIAIKMAAKGKDAGDIEARQEELDKSLTNIQNMRSDTKTEFRYASINSAEARLYNKGQNLEGPTTQYTAKNDKGDVVVTMFIENNMGSFLHEGRHGGDYATGALRMNTSGGYGVSHEVSAYRAQYSWSGSLQYRPADYFSNYPQMQSAFNQLGESVIPPISVVDINSITPSLVNNIGTTVKNSEGNKAWMPLYPPSYIIKATWDNH